jgi:hypothetical protein
MSRLFATTVAFAAMGSALAGCADSQQTSDRELGNLVHAPVERIEPIATGRAASDVGELTRALALKHRVMAPELGDHRVVAATTVEVREGDQVVENLRTDITIDAASTGRFHLLSNNTADYGRETIFVDGALYLRPRYGRWHRRMPTTPDEPAQILDEGFAMSMATWDLLAPAAAVEDGGPVTIGGRPGRAIRITTARAPAPLPREELSQRKWREQRTIAAVTGTVVLDEKSGIPMNVKLAGQVGFVREGRTFVMNVTCEHTLEAMTVAVAAPEASEVVATPERAREVDDRNALLRGIAPLVDKAASGTDAERESGKTP